MQVLGQYTSNPGGQPGISDSTTLNPNGDGIFYLTLASGAAAGDYSISIANDSGLAGPGTTASISFVAAASTGSGTLSTLSTLSSDSAGYRTAPAITVVADSAGYRRRS